MTPTLYRDAEVSLGKLYDQARRRVARTLQRYGEEAAADTLPATCPYSLDDICREDWYPERVQREP